MSAAAPGLADLRREEPHLFRLARAVSLAVRAEPALVRRSRLLLVPAADPGVEADLWFHPMVRHASGEGIVFAPEAGDELRKGLAEEEPEVYERAWELTRECHAGWSPALRLEEEVLYLAHSRRPEARERIRRLLASALAALVAGDRRGLAQWASRALPRFPAEVRALEEAAMLGAAADLRLEPRIVPAGELPSAPAEWMPWLAPAARAEVGVRLLEGILEVAAPLPEVHGYHAISLLRTDPLVLDVLGEEEQGPGERLEIRQGESKGVRVAGPVVRLRTLLGEEYRLEEEAAAWRREALDFSGVFERNRPAYEVGFDSLLQRVFGQDDEPGYVLVVGPPGAGKTALLCHLATRFQPPGAGPAPHHFFRREVRAWADLGIAERSLAAQVARLTPSHQPLSSPSLPHALERWSAARGKDEKPLLLLLDGLEQVGSPEALGELLPARLPAGVRIVCSMRSDHPVEGWLRERRPPREVLEPPPPSASVLRLRWLLESSAARGRGSTQGRASETPVPDAIDRSSGRWWLLRILDDAEKVRPRSADELPPELEGRHQPQMEDVVTLLWARADERLRRGWAVTCVAREALSEPLLARIVGRKLLKPRGRELEVLLEEHSTPAGRLWFPRSDVIAAALVSFLGEQEVRRHHQVLLASIAAWPLAAEETESLTDPEREERRRFALRHAIHHAVRAGDREQLDRLVTDVEYLEERLRLEGPEPLIADLEAAAEITRDLELGPDESITAAADDRGSASSFIGPRVALLQVLRAERQRLRDAPEALRSLLHNRLTEARAGGARREPEPFAAFRLPAESPFLHLLRVHRTSAERGGEGEPVRGHRGPVRGVRWLPRKGELLSWGADGRLLLWHLESATPRPLGAPLGGEITGCALLGVSTTPQAVAAACRDGTVALFALGVASRHSLLRGHEGAVLGATAIEAASSATRFATFSEDGTLRVWSPSGEPLQVLRGHAGAVTAAVQVGKDHLASGGADGTVRVWDVRSGTEVQRLEAHTAPVTVLTAGPKSLATAGEDSTVRLWKLSTRSMHSWQRLDPGPVLVGHRSAVTAVGFALKYLVVTTSLDHTLRTWDAGSGKAIDVKHLPAAVTGLAFSGERWIAACADGALAASPQKGLSFIDAHAMACRGCDLSPDEKRVASWSDDGSIRIWDMEALRRLASLEEPEVRSRPLVTGARRWIVFGPRQVFEARLDRQPARDLGAPAGSSHSWIAVAGDDPDATRVAFGGDLDLEMAELTGSTPDGEKKVPTRLEHRWRRSLRATSEESPITALCVTGERAVVVREDRLELWSERGTLSIETGHRRRISGCATIDRGRLLSWSWDGTLRIHSIEPLPPTIAVLEGHRGPILACAVDPRRGHALSASADASLRLWDLAEGRLLRVWEEVSGHVTALLLDPRRDLRLAGSAKGDLFALTLDGAAPVRTAGHQGPVRAFAPDPSSNAVRFYSLGDDGTMRLWELTGDGRLRAVGTAYADAALLSASAIGDVVAAQDSRGSLWIYGRSGRDDEGESAPLSGFGELA